MRRRQVIPRTNLYQLREEFFLLVFAAYGFHVGGVFLGTQGAEEAGWG
jgi:hypothetical protein